MPQRGDQTCEKMLAATHQSTAPQAHAEKQSNRLVLAYQAACVLVMAIGLLWAGFFAWKQLWTFAIPDMILVLVAAVGWWLLKSGRLNAALIVTQLALLIFITCYALTFDPPTADIPRNTHLFLLDIALLGYINHLRDSSKIQLAIIAACLCAFIVLASTPYVFPFAQPISNEIRANGVWVNSILATAILCGGIYAIQREFTRPKGLALELRNAVRNDEMELYFQPQIDHAGTIHGAEALLRWQHPQHGQIPPGDFIPVAEDAGLMPLLGGWVLNEACRTLALWSDDPVLGKLTLAVNVSASQFQLEDFESSVLETLRIHRVDPTRLKLELTESVLVQDLGSTIAKMQSLRATGITFALDDFGTGYSSLSYLRRLPLDQLKIDRSFVQESLESQRGAALVKSIVQLGIDLGFVVLAEGIETPDQHTFLLACGCHEFQGYFFGRPVPEAAFAAHVWQAAAPAPAQGARNQAPAARTKRAARG
ncbi:EAL domain-containing protein [Hoeflea sp. IMCC20628]|uniref:putative bifunctional diguanylate cyclase/phosphodiesterase n=1 Tax=Hoeflea sp. IMCC20628 TaxID=1620421 RepID=UPI00063BF5D4|nr:EAL domain-containing protein [Hoeflea sp. IMCC20628]AKI01277.1 EAL domain-containing protein [Hoeflea sp. IMCC20628]